MPIIRNPFRRVPGEHVNDENAKPASVSSYLPTGLLSRKTEPEGDANKKPINIDLAATKEPHEFKLSEINEGGVYLPPSPSETQSFWSMRPSSSRRSSHRNVLNENEPFNISRESFDSYRRSFDISARSPVLEASPSQRSRQSMEARSTRFPSAYSFSTSSFSSMRSHSLSAHPSQRSVTTLASRYTADSASPVILAKDDLPAPPNSRTDRLSFADDGPITEEPLHEEPESRPRSATAIRIQDTKDTIPEPEAQDRFEDVTLHDPKPKRHWLPYRFGVGNSSSNTANPTESADANRPPSSSGGHGFFGRKRGASGQGSELGNMIRRPASRGPAGPTDKTQATANGKPQTPTPNTDKGPFAAPKVPAPADRNSAVSKTAVSTEKSATSTRSQTPAPVDRTAVAPAPTPTTTATIAPSSILAPVGKPVATPTATPSAVPTPAPMPHPTVASNNTEVSQPTKTTAAEIASAVVAAPVVDEIGGIDTTTTANDQGQAQTSVKDMSEASPRASTTAGAQEFEDVDVA